MAFDATGDLFVVNNGYDAATGFAPGTTVSEFAPGATTPTATLTGLSGPYALPLTRPATSSSPGTPQNGVRRNSSRFVKPSRFFAPMREALLSPSACAAFGLPYRE